MADARHHHAVQIVFVGGSPETVRQAKPGRYPHQPREHWTGPPKRKSKAEVLREFMRRIAEQNQAVREMLRPDATLLKAKWGIAA